MGIMAVMARLMTLRRGGAWKLDTYPCGPKKEECPICLDLVTACLKCGHLFHVGRLSIDSVYGAGHN